MKNINANIVDMLGKLDMGIKLLAEILHLALGVNAAD